MYDYDLVLVILYFNIIFNIARNTNSQAHRLINIVSSIEYSHGGLCILESIYLKTLSFLNVYKTKDKLEPM